MLRENRPTRDSHIATSLPRPLHTAFVYSSAPCAVATTDEELAALGGLEANDRVDVVPWLEQAQRFSFVSSDPRALDLAGWEALAATNEQRTRLATSPAKGGNDEHDHETKEPQA